MAPAQLAPPDCGTGVEVEVAVSVAVCVGVTVGVSVAVAVAVGVSVSEGVAVGNAQMHDVPDGETTQLWPGGQFGPMPPVQGG